MGAIGTKHYAKGTRFEHDVMDDLHDNHGFVCMRAAGSKGGTKIDVIAFKQGYPLLFIQAKSGASAISKEEWDRIVEVAGWYPGAAIPVLASKTAGQKKPVYYKLTGPKIPYAQGIRQNMRLLIMSPVEMDPDFAPDLV